MKNIVKTALVLTMLTSCSDPNFTFYKENMNKPASGTPAGSQPCTVTRLGDKDGFGMGLPDRGTLSLKAGTSFPIDHRSANDPKFTDIYPADLGGTSDTPYEILFKMEFEKPNGPIANAKFRLNTLGIQDGDNQVCGSHTDTKVFIDGFEIPNALDDVDQFDLINGAWSDIASVIEIKIPANLLYLLDDGKVQVKWTLTTNSPSHDAFSIDYCELEICSDTR